MPHYASATALNAPSGPPSLAPLVSTGAPTSPLCSGGGLPAAAGPLLPAPAPPAGAPLLRALQAGRAGWGGGGGRNGRGRRGLKVNVIACLQAGGTAPQSKHSWQAEARARAPSHAQLNCLEAGDADGRGGGGRLFAGGTYRHTPATGSLLWRGQQRTIGQVQPTAAHSAARSSSTLGTAPRRKKAWASATAHSRAAAASKPRATPCAAGSGMPCSARQTHSTSCRVRLQRAQRAALARQMQQSHAPGKPSPLPPCATSPPAPPTHIHNDARAHA